MRTKEQQNKYNKTHYNKCKNEGRERSVKHNKDYYNNIRLSRYGITLEQYNAMVAAQDNKCLICGLEENTVSKSGITKVLAVDHCHTTGKVRGLLCYKCNVGIGHLQDSIEVLESAIQYLKAAKSAGSTSVA